jgi:hypothetical protein
MSQIISGTMLGLNTLTYLPTNYDKTKAYPCLVFLPGSGEQGTDASKLLVHGPFAFIKQGVDLGLNLIVIAVQSQNQHPRPVEVQQYLTAIKALYSISAFIGSGISRGGESFDWFICNSESNLGEMAAMYMVSSEGPVNDLPSIPGTWTPQWFVDKGTSYWACVGDQDSFYNANANSILNRINSLKAVAPQLAFITVFKGSGHDNTVWGPSFQPGVTLNAQGQDYLHWAATFGSAVGVPQPPPVVIPPVTPPVTPPVAKVIKSVVVNYTDGTNQTLLP